MMKLCVKKHMFSIKTCKMPRKTFFCLKKQKTKGPYSTLSLPYGVIQIFF